MRNYKAYNHGSCAVIGSLATTDAQADSIALKRVSVTGTLVNADHFMAQNQKGREVAKEVVSDLPLELNLPETRVNLKSDF